MAAGHRYRGRLGTVTVRERVLLPTGAVRARNIANLGRMPVARCMLDPGPEVTRTMAQRMSTAEARKDFAALLRSSEKGERIKLTRYNKTVAVLIPKHDLDELEDCQGRKHRDGEAKATKTHRKPARMRTEKSR